ncbi:MAG TPA: type III pantothenate kinase [Alphaproteobacteria bacterium]|nr:type III pantothenate kinase [Alphaproteobacteria bacterium]
MLLAIDAGNTNVVFAAFEGEVLKGSWRCATEVRRTRDEFCAFLDYCLHAAGLKRTDFKHAIIASVVPDLDFTLKTLCRQDFGCEPLIIAHGQCELGINVLLPRPQEVGADRLVNAVAARHLYGDPLVIIDFGTATTFDVVDQEGYRGGVIAPGINLSLEALHRAAAKLPRVNVDRPAHVIGTSTIEAMQSGIYWGYISLIEGLVERIGKDYARHSPKAMKVIATGGLSPLFQAGTKVIQHTNADLTLTGLRLIFARSQQKMAA